MTLEAKLYYTAPSDSVFEEVKEKAMEIWGTYDDPYKTDKQNRIKDIGNVKDNVMYIVAMFDHINQRKLAQELSVEARLAIRERMIDGGASEYLNPF